MTAHIPDLFRKTTTVDKPVIMECEMNDGGVWCKMSDQIHLHRLMNGGGCSFEV